MSLSALDQLDQLQSTPLWLHVKDRDNKHFLKHPHYLAPGVFGESNSVHGGTATYEVFNQRQINVILSSEVLSPVAAISLSLISDHPEKCKPKKLPLLNFPDGGIFPRLSVQHVSPPGKQEHVWHFPVGSLVFQCLLNGDISGRALVPIPCKRLTSRNWKRRHHIYGNPGNPFQTTALVYRDSTDQICYVEEHNLSCGEAVVIDRFSLLW
jgi:hypothetical protein